MLEWLFWEQYSHEPYVAVVRFRVKYQGKARDELDPGLIAGAEAALRRPRGRALPGAFTSSATR